MAECLVFDLVHLMVVSKAFASVERTAYSLAFSLVAWLVIYKADEMDASQVDYLVETWVP